MAEKKKTRRANDPRGCKVCGPNIGRHRRLLRNKADEAHGYEPKKKKAEKEE